MDPTDPNRIVYDDTDLKLTPAEVADLFGVGVPTITEWNRKGILPCVRTPGNRRRYREVDVKRLLNATVAKT